MATDAGYADGLPGLCGQEPLIAGAIAAGPQRPVYPGQQHAIAASATFAVALHITSRSPLPPAAGDADLRSARIITNPAWMMNHQDIGDHHNAPVFPEPSVSRSRCALQTLGFLCASPAPRPISTAS